MKNVKLRDMGETQLELALWVLLAGLLVLAVVLVWQRRRRHVADPVVEGELDDDADFGHR